MKFSFVKKMTVFIFFKLIEGKNSAKKEELVVSKKQALVDFEGVQEFFLDTITKAILKSEVLSQEQKEQFADELDNALDSADFSTVEVHVIEKEE